MLYGFVDENCKKSFVIRFGTLTDLKNFGLLAHVCYMYVCMCVCFYIKQE